MEVNAMDKTNFRSAERIQQGLLASWEKAALAWLAERMPARINSDHLTLLGFSAMLAAGVFYFLSARRPWMLHLVTLSLVANWFGDSLDGTLARYRRMQRPRYGFYVDHITDAVGTMFLLTGLAFSGFMSERVAFALLVLFLLLSINSYLWAHAMGRFQLSFWKFSPTELRVLLILGNFYLLRDPMVGLLGYRIRLFDLGGIIGACLMALMLLISTARHTRQLHRLERI
jgi:archaetidylinositol phosphate synthase